MSESGASAAQNVSSFPMPPMQYVNLYSDENIRKGRAPKPPPPIKDSYSMFGIQFRADDQIIRPLENQGLRRLYPHNYDHKRELKKLNYSILVNFLDLLDILIKAPDSGKRCEKIDDLTLLFIHMHHLINEFRPHQARETLRVMLDLQNRQRFETLERFQLHVSHVKDIIQSSISVLPDDSELDSKLVVARPLALPFTSRDDAVSPSLNDVELDTDDLSYSGNEQSVYNNEALDEMMCGIVDNMT